MGALWRRNETAGSRGNNATGHEGTREGQDQGKGEGKGEILRRARNDSPLDFAVTHGQRKATGNAQARIRPGLEICRLRPRIVLGYTGSTRLGTLDMRRGKSSIRYFANASINLIPAGPAKTTPIAGKMNNTRGIISLTAVFWARSSASWRRLVRMAVP